MNGTVNRAKRILDVPNKFSSIGEALEAAQDGDVIRIKHGRYREQLVIKKRVHLVGVGSGQKVIIEAPAPLIWEGSEGPPTILLQTAEAKLGNLSIVGNSSAPAVIDNMCGEITIEGCAVRGGGAATGIRISDSATGTIRFCNVSECRAHGVAVQRQGHAAMEKTHVFRCHCGVMVGDLGSQCALRGCHIQLNFQAGVVVHSSGQVLVDESEVTRNAVAGVALSVQARGVLSSNRIADNGKVGVCLSEQSLASIRGCDLRGNAGRPLLKSESCDDLVELEGNSVDGIEGDATPKEKLVPSPGARSEGGNSL